MRYCPWARVSSGLRGMHVPFLPRDCYALGVSSASDICVVSLPHSGHFQTTPSSDNIIPGGKWARQSSYPSEAACAPSVCCRSRSSWCCLFWAAAICLSNPAFSSLLGSSIGILKLMRLRLLLPCWCVCDASAPTVAPPSQESAGTPTLSSPVPAISLD